MSARASEPDALQSLLAIAAAAARDPQIDATKLGALLDAAQKAGANALVKAIAKERPAKKSDTKRQPAEG